MYLDFKNDFAILFLQGFSFLGGLGNFLFIFISSWFLTNAKFSAKKIFRLWIELFFYSATIALIFYFLKIPCFFKNHIAGAFEAEFNEALYPPTIQSLLSGFMPFSRSISWFVSCYILFYICVPFLNKLILSLSQKEHLAASIISAIYTMVIPMIPFNGIAQYASGNLVIFIAIFFIASYLKIYPVKFLENKNRNFILAITLFSLLVLWRIAIVYVFANKIISIQFLISRERNILNIFTSMKSFPLLLLTIFIFFGFKNLNIKTSKIINYIASTTLGIYLIHDNSFVRYFLWFKVFRLSEHFHRNGFLLYLLFAIAATFIASALIDFLRQILFRFIANRTNLR